MKTVFVFEPSACAHLAGAGVGFGVGGGGAVGVGRGVRVGVRVGVGVGWTAVRVGVGATVGVGDSTTADGKTDGLASTDGAGDGVGGTVGVGVIWTKIGRVDPGELLAPDIGVGAGPRGANSNRTMAPPANTRPAKSTAPKARRPWPPPPWGSVDSVRL